MRLLYSAGRSGNPWLNQTIPKIPLGPQSHVYEWPTDRFPLGRWLPVVTPNVVFIRFPEIMGQQISDTVLIAGGTGSGKSTMAKVLECFYTLKRPLIDYDWAGQDSHLMHEANSDPRGIPPGIGPTGIPGIYLYYPGKAARPKKHYERTVRPNLAKYDTAQLQALGFSPGAAKYFQTIVRKYGPFSDMESLYQFIEHFPSDDNESKRTIAALQKGKLRLSHRKWYKPNDTIHKNSKESLKKILPGIIEMGVFRLDNHEEFNFQQAFLEGKNIIFSFNSKDVGRVEINYYMSQTERIRKQFPASPRYMVKVEEAHKVLGTGSMKKEQIDEVIEDFVLVCRKMSVGLILVMPEVINLSSRVLNDMKTIITGKFKGDNANKLIAAMGYDPRAKIIPYLKHNRYTGEREFIVYSQDYGTIFRYTPYNSPCEIHREYQHRPVGAAA